MSFLSSSSGDSPSSPPATYPSACSNFTQSCQMRGSEGVGEGRLGPEEVNWRVGGGRRRAEGGKLEGRR
eukprot:179294-Pyramimonas_sp.AAC.1